jgi:hypothetical protein
MRFELGEILAVTFLLVVTAGLIFAAFYARYGKPATAEGKGRKEQVENGLRLGFGTVAGICTLMLLVYAFEKFRHPDTDDSLLTFLKGYPPRIVGGLSFAAGLAILWVTVGRWAKFLSGLFAYAVIGALAALASGGFHSRIASLQLTRLECGIMAALIAACALLTMRLNSGALNWADRASALSAPLLLTWGMTSDNAATEFKVLTVIVVCFGAAAAYDYVWCRRYSKRRAA